MFGPPGHNISGNWQFSATSMVPGMPPVTIAGSIAQSGNSVTGAVHIDGSNCFDQLTTIGLTATLTGSNISLTSTSVDGQVIAFTGSITGADTAFAGSYSTNGGCANGDQGNVSGFKVRRVDGDWRVILESRSEERWIGRAMLTQSSASSEGGFGITGTADVNLPCFSGTIRSGTFPSPSFILGTFMAIEIETDDGTLVFRGTANESGNFVGSHQVFGGTCDGEFGLGCFGPLRAGSCFE